MSNNKLPVASIGLEHIPILYQELFGITDPNVQFNLHWHIGYNHTNENLEDIPRPCIDKYIELANKEAKANQDASPIRVDGQIYIDSATQFKEQYYKDNNLA